MQSNTNFEESSNLPTDVQNFAEALANDLVEEGVLDGCIEVAFQEELESTPHSDITPNSSITNLQRYSQSLSSEDSDTSGSANGGTVQGNHPADSGSLAVVFAFFAWLLKPNIMARILLVIAIVICGGNLFNFIKDAYSQPKIVKARAARPFFSNSSANYLTDYYHGNMRPEYALKTTDMLIVMYYAPWSTESNYMRRAFEVNARMFAEKQAVKFVAINCWPAGSLCKSTYKITKFPIIAAYSNTVSLAYAGEHSIDHLYRWLRGLFNPITIVHSMNDIEQLRSANEKTVVAYFPFKNMQTPDGYRSFAAAGIIMNSGKSQDYATKMAYTTSLPLARSLQLRYEGDIVMLRRTGDATFYPPISRTAFKIVEWVRKERDNSSLTWIYRNRNDNVFTEQFAHFLNSTAAIVLADKSKVVYSNQQSVATFGKISEEYWKCQNDSVSTIEQDITDQENTYNGDTLFCDEVSITDIEMILPCCRSLFSSVDWNVACASSTKYKWEGEPEVATEGKRRNHWTDERIPVTEACEQRRNNTAADSLIHGCCNIYDTLTSKELSSDQSVIGKRNLLRIYKSKQDKCLRSKLNEYMNYDQEEQLAEMIGNNSVTGFGCTKNSTLQFVVLDMTSYQYILSKWGLSKEKISGVFIIDTKREILSPLKTSFSSDSIRTFIRDYHSLTVQTLRTNEVNLPTRFSNSNSGTDGVLARSDEIQTIVKINRTGFLDIVEKQNSTSDEVVFFTGGRWHSASATVLHIYHQIANYFSNSKRLIKFYMIDVNRNELPYNFNFERLPAVVLFIAGRRDISWKYPDSLPLSLTNLLSFILSRSSPQLRWHAALSRCGRMCRFQNIHRLRRHKDVLLRDIRFLGILINSDSDVYNTLRERRISQLAVLSSTIRRMKSFEQNSHLEGLDHLLDSREFQNYFSLVT